MRIVIDTNDYISALIGKRHREKLSSVLNQSQILIYADETLIDEIKGVGYRDKFRKYVSLEDVDDFIAVLQKRLNLLKPQAFLLIAQTLMIIIYYL